VSDASAATGIPLLRVDGVSVRYRTATREVPAVRDVSFELAPGESLGLAGESGCGKSTLAGAILRLLPKGTQVDGRIELHGENVLTMTPGRLRAVRWAGASIVFQGALHALNPVQRISKQIAEPMLVHRTVTSKGAAASKVASLLEHVGLAADRAHAYPHQLSGGQRQRVLIAMALACDPELLIADEPTTALDVMVQAQVLGLLGELQRDRGLSMIFITHDLSVLSGVCDRLAVMYAGTVVEEGPAHELFRSARHPYTQALAAAFPTIGDPSSRMRPTGLPGDPPDPANLPEGCAFHPRCAHATAVCRAARPELRVTAPGRRAACVLVEEPAA
jgi:peptide/nickel transport system ATP-binding protein